MSTITKVFSNDCIQVWEKVGAEPPIVQATLVIQQFRKSKDNTDITLRETVTMASGVQAVRQNTVQKAHADKFLSEMVCLKYVEGSIKDAGVMVGE